MGGRHGCLQLKALRYVPSFLVFCLVTVIMTRITRKSNKNMLMGVFRCTYFKYSLLFRFNDYFPPKLPFFNSFRYVYIPYPIIPDIFMNFITSR